MAEGFPEVFFPLRLVLCDSASSPVLCAQERLCPQSRIFTRLSRSHWVLKRLSCWLILLQLPAVPPALACTSDLQRWHRPRTQGIHPEPASKVIVRKPKTVGKRCLQSTLYRAFPGPLPDPDIIASGEKLCQLESPPLIALVLEGLSTLELVPSKFGPVPRGSPMSYQCPPEKSCDVIIIHHTAPDFPALPLMFHSLTNMCFVPTLGQLRGNESARRVRTTSLEIGFLCRLATRSHPSICCFVGGCHPLRRLRVSARPPPRPFRRDCSGGARSLSQRGKKYGVNWT
uniref:Uncharacterized protein n=1 Tax=Knipowitschia caucasica TaxID=637954 RepID=A0AAV2J1L6_KNICA